MNTLTESQPSVWKSRSFIILFSSALFVSFSAQIYSLALPLLVFELSQSSEMMGWMRAIEFIPNLLLALFIGVWVDRVDKKRWSQAMLVGQAFTVLVSYCAVQWLADPLWVLFPCAFVMMTFNYGYHNARMTMIKGALPLQLQNTATARMSSLNSFMETIGPVLSGALMLFSAIHNVFLLVAFMMIVAYWQTSKLGSQPSKIIIRRNIWQELKEGWSILRAEQNMWQITLAVMVINTTGAVFWIQAIFYAKTELQLNSIEVSYLIAASGIGGLAGAFSADKVRSSIGLGKLLILSIFLESFGFIMPLFSDNQWMLTFSFLWISAVGIYSTICIWSYRQEAFAEQHLGRIAGITGSLFKLLMPFGLAGSGYLVTQFGIDTVFITCFIVQTLAALSLLASRVKRIA